MRVRDIIHPVGHWSAIGAKRLEHALAFHDIAAPAHDRDNQWLLARDDGDFHCELIGSGLHEFAIETQEPGDIVPKDQHAAENLADRMELEIERRDDSKVAAAA